MHERKDAGQDRCRKECWDKGWRDIGEEHVGRKEQERREAVKEGCRRGEMHE